MAFLNYLLGKQSPDTVSEESLAKVGGWEFVCGDRDTVSLLISKCTNHHIVLSLPFLTKCFVIFISSDRNEARSIFNSLSHKLLALAKASNSLNAEKVQNLWDAIRKHPTYGCSHIASFLGLPNLLSNANIKRSIDKAEERTGKTPLHVAVELEKLGCIRMLLNLDANVSAVDFKGNTPLHFAARCSKGNILEEVVSKGIPFINNTNHDGETALHEACLKGCPENVKILLECGANPSLTKSSRKPIHCAVSEGNTGCIEILNNRDVNLIDAKEASTGNSLLHLAKSKEMMHFLIELGCSAEERNKKKQTPLLLRVQDGDLSLTLGLLVVGADFSALDGNGLTALHLAIKRERLDLVRALIIFGADVNQCSCSGVPPLHEAVQLTGQNRDEILNCLEMAGAKSQRNCCHACTSLRNTDRRQGATGSALSNNARRVVDDFFEKSALVAALNRSQCSYGADDDGRKKPKAGSRVLCLDGGGIRGLVTIKILMAVEHVTGRPIRKSFDWVGGTSTGGILAMGLLHGKTLIQMMGAYFRLKDSVFQGEKPYESEPLENFLKKELGEHTMMADVQKPRVMLMAVLADRRPAELFIFRNYHVPGIRHDSTVSSLQGSEPLPRPEDQLAWQALRATSAAPTYFRASGRFIDGGLIANNPTLDVLSEIHKFNIANKAAEKHSEVEPIHVVVSVGTGKVPLKPVTDYNSTITFCPQNVGDCIDSVKAAKNLVDLLTDQSTQPEGQTVSRAAAWCNMIDVPYYRLNPQLSEDIPLDCTKDSKLVNMLWETECYLHENEEKLIQLANLLK